MNAKQTAPLLVTLPALAAAAPALIIGGAIGLGVVLVLKSLLSDDDKEKKPKTVPANKAEIPGSTRNPLFFVKFRRKFPPSLPSLHVQPRRVSLLHRLPFHLCLKSHHLPLCPPPLSFLKSRHKLRRRRSKRNALHAKKWLPSSNAAQAL